MSILLDVLEIFLLDLEEENNYEQKDTILFSSVPALL